MKLILKYLLSAVALLFCANIWPAGTVRPVAFHLPRGAAAGGTTLLLDETGLTATTAAFSVRKLRSAYSGSALRVRRSSDNSEQDIGFSGNNLDTASMESFVGGGNNGFVVTLYNQSTNASCDMTQATAARQPKIVSSGATITGSNGKPAIQFASVSNWRLGGTIPVPSAITFSTVFSLSDTTYYKNIIGATGTGIEYRINATPGYPYIGRDGGSGVAGTNSVATNWVCLAVSSTTTNQVFRKNAAADGTGSASFTFTGNMTRIGSASADNQYFNGYLSELTIFPSALSTATMDTAQANQNAYFTIY